MRKALLIYTLVVLASVLSGCGYRDIDKRHFVTAVGVDKLDDEEKPFEVTLKIALPPTDPKAFSNESLILSEKAESISEAVRLIKANVSKELDFGHMKLMLYGKDMIKSGEIRGMLDWATRRRDIQQISWIAVAEPTAKEVLELKPKEETIPSNFIFIAFSREGTDTPYLTKTRLFEFRRAVNTKGINAVLPLIKAKGKDSLEMNRAVVFGNDPAENLILSAEETKNFNILRGNADKTDIKVKDEKHNFQIAVGSIKTDYKIKKEKPKIEYNVKFEGIIEESKETLHEDDLKKYTKVAEKESTKRVLDLLEKLRENNLDPLGFGLRYRARTFNHDDEIKTWEKMYQNIKFNVNVNTQIKSTGVIE